MRLSRVALGTLSLLLLATAGVRAQGVVTPQFVSVHAGAQFSCGLTAEGALFCWGGEMLALGRPDGWDHGMERLAPGRRFERVEVSAEVCGVTQGQTLCWSPGNRAWQMNLSVATVLHCSDCDQSNLDRIAGALGHPVREMPGPGSGVRWFLFPDFTSPIPLDEVPFAPASLRPGYVPLLGNWQFAAAGWCGLDDAGAVRCWYRDREQERAHPPAPVGGTLRFTDIALGETFGCGLTREGAAYCWGNGGLGALGPHRPGLQRCVDPSGRTMIGVAAWPCSRLPVAVAPGLVFRSITASGGHACALTADGKAYCWGSDVLGQLGRGSQAPQLPWWQMPMRGATAPEPVAGDLRFRSLSASEGLEIAYTCGLTGDGALYCWGRAPHLGFGGESDEGGDRCQVDQSTQASCALNPVRVGGSVRFRSLSTTPTHICGLDVAGDAWCWGDNTFGQLGDGTTTSSTEPVKVTVPVFPPADARIAITGG